LAISNANYLADMGRSVRPLRDYDTPGLSDLQPAQLLLYTERAGVVCRLYSAWALRYLGFPDRVLQRASAQAHDLLAPVCGWFTEGFAIPDLKDARALLDQLAKASTARYEPGS
jgi:hypothetical protein